MLVARIEPTGPREARPDDKLREMREQPSSRVTSLHPGYAVRGIWDMERYPTLTIDDIIRACRYFQ